MTASDSPFMDGELGRLFDSGQLAELAERFATRPYAIGAIIIRSGQHVRQMHIIRSGRVLLYAEAEDGERRILRECREGTPFGELVLLDGSTSPFTAIAAEETQLLSFDRQQLEELLARHPELGRALLGSLAIRLRSAFEALRHEPIAGLDERLDRNESGGMRVARWVSSLAGSWRFFVVFLAGLISWLILGRGTAWPLHLSAFDPFPYPLLILVLSALAAIQAPVILLVVNGIRQRNHQRERVEAELNERLQLQVAQLHAKVDGWTRWTEDRFDPDRVARLEAEILRLRAIVDEERHEQAEILGRLADLENRSKQFVQAAVDSNLPVEEDHSPQVDAGLSGTAKA